MKQRLLLFFVALLATVSASAYDFYVNGIYYNKNGSNATVTYRNDSFNSYSGIVTIPESVNYNGVTYPVTSIGEFAFDDCRSLTSVTIPNSVTSIGASAFDDCRSLTSVTIPNSVTSIGASAFYGCTGLTKVTIGTSVKSIGSSAFCDCTGLTTVNFNATNCSAMGSSGFTVFSGCSNLKTVDIGENVTQIPNYAFSGCTGLTSVTIPNSVTSIGYSAFAGCSGLTEVTIPNSVTSIGNSAFEECNSLTSVTIPDSVTFIGKWAFSDCTGLKKITCYNSDPSSITLGTDVFQDVPTSECLLYVPVGSVDLYKAAKQWMKFTNILAIDDPAAVEPLYVGTERGILLYSVGENIVVKDTFDGEDILVYDLHGQKLFAGKADGYQFVIPVALEKGNIYLVKVGGRTVKYLF